MKLIELHGINGKGKFAKVDDEDYEYLSQWRWFGVYIKSSSNYYVIRNSTTGTTRMHILIMGKKEGLIIDHIDGDGLNNQKSNLRHCTHSQNAYNKRNRRNSTSKYKGVSKKGNKWTARIQKEKKAYELGVFSTEILASEAYNKAAIKLFGEYAKLNLLNNDDNQGVLQPDKKIKNKPITPIYTGVLPPKSKAIYLSKGKFTIVSEEDYDFLNQWKWCAKESSGNIFYAHKNGKRLGKGLREKSIKMHTLLMQPPKGMVVDHINRNSLDNRRENLRVVTQKVNVHNTSRSLRNLKYSIQLKLI